MTLACTNYCQLYITFVQILIITHHLKFEEIFWTSQKHSTKYGMKVYYTNLNLLVFQEIFLSYIFRSFLKGVRYKTITSQNVSFEAQIKNFYFAEKYVLFSRYLSICIFNHPMIYQICDITMSICTWDKVQFWIYLLNHNSWSHQTWPVDRYK